MSDDLRASVLNLTTLIDYQKGSVVSRTLIKKDTGTVTLFAFEKGEALSEHIAPFDALVSIVDGTADITIDGELYQPQKGEFIIMPANKPHAVKATERFKMLLVMIRS